MAYKQTRGGEIKGHLDIFVVEGEALDADGNVESSQEVLIHGNPKGFRSFAKLLLQIADLNQEQAPVPVGAREHYHLRPGWELSDSSVEVIVGRLDAKGTGEFYSRFVPKSKKVIFKKNKKDVN
ncbi:MAG: hypothetical protein EOP52_04610 [Sphingobacteriales bacterium]|nr:MAG: hypothetical protein EOP52_04610 [Sphingobacteriales bacterium]